MIFCVVILRADLDTGNSSFHKQCAVTAETLRCATQPIFMLDYGTYFLLQCAYLVYFRKSMDGMPLNNSTSNSGRLCDFLSNMLQTGQYLTILAECITLEHKK